MHDVNLHLLLFSQWKEVDSSQLMDSKLKCVFVMPENGNVGESADFPAQQASAPPMSVPTSHLQPEQSAAALNTNQNSSDRAAAAPGKVSVPQVNTFLRLLFQHRHGS